MNNKEGKVCVLRWQLEFIIMSRMSDKTVKTEAFSGQIAPSNLSEAQEKALDLIKRGVQLEEMKGAVQEHLQTIEQLRQNLKQEKEKVAALEVKDVERAALEIRVKELTEALSKISGIAAAGKTN
ncbi:MAG: hypothetical protein ABL858_08580 [Candidatus Nitrotoga sp.]